MGDAVREEWLAIRTNQPRSTINLSQRKVGWLLILVHQGNNNGHSIVTRIRNCFVMLFTHVVDEVMSPLFGGTRLLSSTRDFVHCYR